MQTQNDKFTLINGRIHTPSSTASNITIEHGRIVFIDAEPENIGGKVIDLHGRTVVPGFCDTGFDFLGWAEYQERLNLSSISSPKNLPAALASYSQANPEPLRGWYIAYGLPASFIITHDDIDAVIPSRPCAVIDAGYTHAVLNTPAMSEFNMPQDNVELDEFTRHLPELTRDDVLSLVKTYAPKVSALGITEVWSNFYSQYGELWDIFASDAYDLLNFRLRCNFGFDDVFSMNEFLASGLRTGDGLPFCRVGGFLVNDYLKQEEQKNMITSAHLSGCQVIGNSTQYCLNALERVIKRFRKTPRHLIKSNDFTSKLLDRMRILGLGGMSSPQTETSSLHEAFINGLVVSACSGDILTPPMKNICSMVSDGLSAAEALSIYTWSASWNGGAEQRRGEIALGNDADLVVLEQDPYLVKPEEIAGIDVTMTFSAGNLVYDSGTI